MLDSIEFAKLLAELKEIEEKREILIQKSRQVIFSSKKIINFLHRGNINSAAFEIENIKNLIKGFDDNVYDTNISKVAKQEFVEAICYFEFLRSGRLLSKDELGVDVDSYLCGICDLTGELVRKGINFVINKNFGGLFEIRNLIDDVYQRFLMLDLRNGDLRKKSDAIKWNLKKLDDVVLEIKLKQIA